jgi:gustatory receptor
MQSFHQFNVVHQQRVMNTVYSAKPSLRIFQIVGATPIAIDRSLKVVPSIKVQTYTFVLLVIFAITFIFGLFNSQLHLNNDNNCIGNTVDYIQLVGIRICHILILIESLLQQGTLCLFFEKINEVDIELQRKLNIIIDYTDSRRRISMRLASLLCFYIFCETVFVLLVMMRNDTEFFEYWAVYLLPFIVCCLKYSQTIGFVQLLKSRYQLLNDKLSSLRWIKPEKKLIVGKEYESCPKMLVQTTTFDEMLVIRGLLNRMFDLSSLVNRLFGWSMLVNVGTDFVAITSNSYFIFVYFQDTTIQNKDSWRILGIFAVFI